MTSEPFESSLNEPSRVYAAGAVGQRHLEEPVALDREVERVAGLHQHALGELFLRRADFHAQADVLADRDLRRSDRRAGSAQLLVDQVLKVRQVVAEPGGVHVRQVVGDRVDVVLLRCHPAGRGEECSHHSGGGSLSSG